MKFPSDCTAITESQIIIMINQVLSFNADIALRLEISTVSGIFAASQAQL
jgi:hypothetical protein